jgi:protein-L-isoaspartate(D-aspartate) O-methyltransferase
MTRWRTLPLAVLLLAAECGPAMKSETDTEHASREAMVRNQILARGVKEPRLLAALRRIPRHLFLEEAYRAAAYADHPAPIGEGQTITQPYVAALMTELLELTPESRTLEVGTGSGYESALLASLSREVYSIEILPVLSQEAQARLSSLGFSNIHFRVGDGYGGWPEKAPFDAILVAAAPRVVPQPLLDQLAPGGRMVIPVGLSYQELKVYSKNRDGILAERSVLPVRFVPMTGEAEKPPAP